MSIKCVQHVHTLLATELLLNWPEQTNLPTLMFNMYLAIWAEYTL